MPFVKQLIQITDDQKTEMLTVLRTLKEVVTEAGPEWIYVRRPNATGLGTGCVYVHNGEPDCIAGRVLAKLGVSTADLSKWEGKVCGQMSSEHLTVELNLPRIPFDEHSLGVLNVAQDSSDSGYSWGSSLEKARAHAREFYGVELS
jgi:hypothetical protein